METISLVILLISLFLCLSLAIYPLITFIKSILLKNEVKKSTSFLTPVSIIISCYNEENYIRDKIESIISEEEWIIGSELIIISCGSTDNTNNILKDYVKRANVNIIFSDEQLSKINGVNLCVERAKNEILIFSDCRQKIKNGSIKQLVHNFNDPNVGTVVATLIDTKKNDDPSFFRSLFNFMALKDSSVSSCLNVYGALYAQRKSIFKKIPNDLLFDDLFVVVSTITQHKRLIQDEHAVIYDENFNQYYHKERISRLVRGLLIFLTRHFRMIMTLPIGVLLRFMTYKYLKLVLPFLLLSIAINLGILLVMYNKVYLTFGLLALLVIPLLFSKTRNFVLLLLRINFYFMSATLAYIFGVQRSNKWEKLKVKN